MKTSEFIKRAGELGFNVKDCVNFYDNENYLNLERDTGKYLFGSKKNIERYQTQFTQKEIDEMKKRFNLDSFEHVEVKE